MKLQGRVATLYLSENGKSVLELAGFDKAAQIGSFEVQVVDTEDLGLWIAVERNGVEYHFLLLWEYVIAVETIAKQDMAVGLSSGKGLG